jgi:hypothetical protein
VTRPEAACGDNLYPASYCANLTGEGGAHTEAKLSPKPYYGETFIDELEIPTDKAAIVALLNGQGPGGDRVPKRSWGLTARGGLHEISEDA